MDAVAQLTAALAGRYAIDREIGRGGMATVFLARDVRHNRKVALKVLDPELRAVLGVERFLSEIQVTANLQHPNLVPLFDSGEANGLLFYVMPFVEGESLRAKLQREKQLAVEDAIRIATAVAGALDYAHRHGVIHRDLKPENILMHDEHPVVADFGIALAVSNAGGNRITQTGLSLGTPQYMSPEQATGDRAIDGRTDVYSLGAVTYEMLVGDPPYTASTVQAIVARILTERPTSVRTLRPLVPVEVAAAVERALEKLPADRWPTAREFANALQSYGSATVRRSRWRSRAADDRLSTTRRRLVNPLRTMVIVAATAVGLGFLGTTIWKFAGGISAPQSVSLTVDPPMMNGVPQRLGDVAISPDGKTIAFVARSDSTSQVYLRGFADAEARPVPGTVGAGQIAFAPNGKWLSVITYSGKILKVAMDGSGAQLLAEDISIFWAGATWENDRTLLIGGGDGNLARIPVSGGQPQLLTRHPHVTEFARPVISDNGQTLLAVEWGPGYTEDDYLVIVSPKTGEVTRTPLTITHPIGIVDDHIVYLNTAGAIFAVPFDPRTRRLTGEPVRIIDGVSMTIFPDMPTAALSRAGTLVYKRGQIAQRLVAVDTTGNARELSQEEHDFTPSRGFNGGRPALSPDGQHIAVTIPRVHADTIAADVWIFDVRTRRFNQLTYIGNVAGAEWTPDGKYVVFPTRQSHNPSIWRQRADGSHAAERLVTVPSQVLSANPTPDGRGIVYCTEYGPELYYLPFEANRRPRRLDDGSLRYTLQCSARVSPNGRWLAYVASDASKTNVYLRPFGDARWRVQVSTDGGDSPVWSHDGKRLYYRRIESNPNLTSNLWDVGSGSLVAASVQTTGEVPVITKRERVLPLREGGVFDVGRDEQSFLMFQRSDVGVHLVITTNWISQLRSRLAGRQ